MILQFIIINLLLEVMKIQGMIHKANFFLLYKIMVTKRSFQHI